MGTGHHAAVVAKVGPGKSAAAVELTVDDLREIESAAARIGAQGARYSESNEKMIDR